MYYPYPHPYDGHGLAYDPPFTPRYSVPEGFQRALSYEGQLHWLADMNREAYEYVQNASCAWVVDELGSESHSSSQLIVWVGTDREIQVVSPCKDAHDGVPECVKTGDVVLCRVNCTDDATKALVVGTLVSACRCNAPAKDVWLVHVRYVVRDLNVRLYNLKTTVDEHETRITELENRTTQVENKVTNLGEQVTNLGDRVTNVENRTTQVENKVTNLGEQVTNLGDRVTNVENRTTQVENRVTNLGDQVTEITQNQTTVTADLTAIRKTLADIVAKFGGGGSIDDKTGAVTWGTSGKAAVGNINVYSQATDPATRSTNYIVTHAGVTDLDLWFKDVS